MPYSAAMKEQYLTHVDQNGQMIPLRLEYKESLSPYLFLDEELCWQFKMVVSYRMMPVTGRILIKPDEEVGQPDRRRIRPAEVVGRFDAKDSSISISLASILLLPGVQDIQDAHLRTIADIIPLPIEQFSIGRDGVVHTLRKIGKVNTYYLNGKQQPHVLEPKELTAMGLE